MKKLLLFPALLLLPFAVLQAQSEANKCWSIDYETWNTTGQPSLYIDCGNDDRFNMGSEMSLEVWVRAHTFAENRKMMGKIEYHDPIDNGYVFGFENLHVYAEYFNPTKQEVPRPGDGPMEPDSSFVHLVTTYSVSSGKIQSYVNGVLSGETTMFPNTAIVSNDRPFIIGNAPWDLLSFQFYGDMDEVRIWDKALSHDEITTRMHAELSGAEQDLIAYYNFNQATGSLIPDNGTNSFDGTLSNADHESTAFTLSSAPVGNLTMAGMSDIKAAWYRNSENYHRISTNHGLLIISNIQEKEFRKYIVAGQNGLTGTSSELAPENPPAGFLRTQKEWYINCAGGVGGGLTILLEDAAAADIPANADINQYVLLYRANQSDNFTAVVRPTKPAAGVFQCNDIVFRDGFYALGYATEEFPVQGWTSVAESPFAKLQLGPNPVSKELSISGLPKNTSISISTLTGEVLYVEKYFDQQQSIDLSALKSGIYLVVFETAKGKIVKKIIKH
ncbi:MAG: T9SS type A sorting domain-containing protein [Bacteroidetes bacterium]|jgi:hypothetical protein|nr:T9SS type A sorting domain-containing protein [Bacteroidota bacterium]